MKDTKIKELKSIARGFTKGMIPKGDNKKKCFMASYPLAGYLDFLGYETEVIEGEIRVGEDIWQHFWIAIDDIIIDATASQFKTPSGEDMPSIFVGQKPEWYQII